MRAAGDRCPDDLFARRRRGPLSPVERRAVEAHLGVCDLCRASVALGLLHDGIPDLPSSDDEAVVARLAGRVVARAGTGAGPARRVAIAAGLALMSTAGAAAAWIAARRAPPPAIQIVHAAPGRSAPEIAPLATATPAAEIAVSTHSASEGHRRRFSTVERTSAEMLGAEGPDTLFAGANAARGAGNLRAAASRYELLERRYPDSPEATVSLVSMGDVLVRLGESSAALRRFDRYLARNAQGPLAPEALFGRARCLRELGRLPEEADAWRALLEKFPGSLYDRYARRRLTEMRADGPLP